MRVAPRLRTTRLHDRLTLLRDLHPELRPGWELAGLCLIAGLLGSIQLAGLRTGTGVASMAGLIGACCGVALLSAVIGAGHRAVVPALVVVVAGALLWEYRNELLSGPLSGPFGYRNATGALLLQTAIACVIAGFTVRNWAVRIMSLLPAIGAATAAVLSSTATVAGLALVPVTLLSIGGRRGSRAAVIVCAVAAAFVVAATAWLGVTYRADRPLTGTAAALADGGITERRLALWHDATALIAANPGGIGHGAFARMSPTALEDRDAVHAHQEFLEQTAELGWATGVLLILVVAWVFGRLFVNPRADAVTALAAAAFAGLVIHASVDYVLHVPVVALCAAALLGTGVAATHRTDEGW
jgi:O-antigen ligase/polysaccharide polymerase Wzy-like membrane protein